MKKRCLCLSSDRIDLIFEEVLLDIKMRVIRMRKKDVIREAECEKQIFCGPKCWLAGLNSREVLDAARLMPTHATDRLRTSRDSGARETYESHKRSASAEMFLVLPKPS